MDKKKRQYFAVKVLFLFFLYLAGSGFLGKALGKSEARAKDRTEEPLAPYPAKTTDMPFTKAELEAIHSLDYLTVGYSSNLDPICYQKKNGELDGIGIEILNRVSKRIGIPFRYVSLPSGKITYEELAKLEVDVIGGVEYNSVNAKELKIRLTKPYLKAIKCLVGKNGAQFEPEMKARLGITSGSETLDQVIHLSYPNFETVYYQTLEKAFTDLQKGGVDFVLQNQYTLDKLLEKSQFSNLSIIAKAELGDLQCLSVFSDRGRIIEKGVEPSVLVSILNIGINSVSEDEADTIIMEKTIERHYQYTLKDMVYINRYLLGIMAAVFAAAFLALFYALLVHRKNIGRLQSNEKRLMEERRKYELKSKLDPLTGLLNKASFEECCRQYLSANPEDCSAFVFLDLDNFKQINDAFGHLEGDQALMRAADAIHGVCRAHSYMCRFGGDEFCVLITDVTVQKVESILQQLIGEISWEYPKEDGSVCLTVSAGCVYFQNGLYDYSEAILMADKILYHAKKAGKKRYQIARASEMRLDQAKKTEPR